MKKLRKSDVGRFGIAFMVYSLVASGPFGVEELIPVAGPGMSLILLATLPILWAFPITLLVREASALLPKSGGVYRWAREAFGEFWGFQFGWWGIAAEFICSATYVVLASSYICDLFGILEEHRIFINLAMVIVFAAINFKGLEASQATSKLISIVILVMFLLLTIGGFLNYQTNPCVPLHNPELTPFESAGQGITIAIWMYTGIDSIGTVSGEVKNIKVLDQGLKIALPMVALSYILPLAASLCVLPEGSWTQWDVGTNGIGFETAFSVVFGDIGMIIFLVVAALSNMSIYSSYMSTCSRMLYALSKSNLFPRNFKFTGKLGKSPYNGIVVIAVVSFILSNLNFSMLIDIEIVFDIALYVGLPFIIISLRQKYPIRFRKQGLYHIKSGKIGIGICTVLLVFIAVFALSYKDEGMTLYYILALSSGVVAYVFFKLIYGGKNGRPDKTFGYHLSKRDLKSLVIFILILGGYILIQYSMTLCFG